MKKPPKTPTKQPKLNQRLSKLKLGLGVLGVIILLGVSCATTAYLYFLNRIYPGIFVGNIDISGLPPDQAKLKLARTIHERSQLDLPLTQPGKPAPVYLSLPSYSQVFNLDAAVRAAFAYGRSRVYFSPVHLTLSQFYQDSSNPALQSLKTAVNQPSVNAQILVDDQDNITLTPSQSGSNLDETALNQAIGSYLSGVSEPPQTLNTITISPLFTSEQARSVKDYLERLKDQPLSLAFQPSDDSPPIQPDPPLTLDLPTLLGLLDLYHPNSTLASLEINHQAWVIQSAKIGNREVNNYSIAFNLQNLRSYLDNLSSSINRPVKEPVFNLDQQTNRVTDFQPPQEGRELDVDGSILAMTQQIPAEHTQKSIVLPVNIIPVKNQLVNKLGVKELLGEGVSHFAGSSLERVFNLSLAASRVSGSLVAPGETFSFDKAVGEISAATGYKEGYIIQNGRTVLDDGGGVCQDPTTLFRAVLYAGLPVVDRTAHAYRVEYYEEGFPPGLDATIYSPTVDFKFKNDTPGYILIETHVDTATNTLYYDLYGTTDGRVATLTTPVVTSVTPAPPPLYKNDPTLPQGVVKQTDYAANGATVVFSRTVTKNGQTIISDTYHSNYKPWQAVYLVGTKT